MKCERCGKPGDRQIGRVAPEGWFFGSFTFDENGDHAPGDLLIVHACSAECRDALWTKMDGHRWDEIEKRVRVADELRRAANVHATKLRQSAVGIRESLYPTGEQNAETAGAIFAKMLVDAADELERRAEQECDWLREKAGNAGTGAA